MVNLAPADVKKEGSAFDLAILISILQSDGKISHGCDLSDKCFVGELSLSGEVRAVSQAENRVQEAKRLGFHKVILPSANMNSCRRIEGIELVPVKAVREAIAESRK
jgi:magnesium chelatase family protein